MQLMLLLPAPLTSLSEMARKHWVTITGETGTQGPVHHGTHASIAFVYVGERGEGEKGARERKRVRRTNFADQAALLCSHSRLFFYLLAVNFAQARSGR